MLIFLFKSMVCLSLLFGLYKLLLSRTTFFRANHATLILITLLSVAVPFVEISVAKEVAAVGYVDSMMSEADYLQLLLLNAGDGVPFSTVSPSSLFTWQNTLALIYIIGVVFCIFQIVRSAVRIMLFIRRTPAYRKEKSYTLLLADDNSVSPYSFGRYVIMSRSDYESNGTAILAHELCHVRNHHSLSVMMMNMLSAILWINPMVWLVREELLLVCEYEADTAVVKQGIDAKQYQLLLIKKAVSPSRYTIANSLNHSSLKKRLTMMRKSKSNRWARLGYLGIALSTALVLPAFAHKDIISPIEETLQENLVESFKSEISFIKPKPGDKMPETVGKGTDFSSPKQILTEENAAKTDDKTKNEDKSKTETVSVSVKTGEALNISGLPDGATPLILIDGKEGSVNDVSMNQVASITVVRGEEATAKYGEKAKDGVILITTKKNAADAAEPQFKDDVIFDVCEQMPQFEGGMKALMQFLAENVRYPEAAFNEGKQGRVILTFVVRKNGDITDIQIANSVDPDLDAEAIRVVGAMNGKWTPGQQNGQPVNCKFTIPVSFRLQ